LLFYFPLLNNGDLVVTAIDPSLAVTIRVTVIFDKIAVTFLPPPFEFLFLFFYFSHLNSGNPSVAAIDPSLAATIEKQKNKNSKGHQRQRVIAKQRPIKQRHAMANKLVAVFLISIILLVRYSASTRRRRPRRKTTQQHAL
jgi:hypothetical protein